MCRGFQVRTDIRPGETSFRKTERIRYSSSLRDEDCLSGLPMQTTSPAGAKELVYLMTIVFLCQEGGFCLLFDSAKSKGEWF